jgi:PAP2 superfamily
MNKTLSFLLGVLLLMVAFVTSCTTGAKPGNTDTAVLHDNENRLTEVIIYDVFAPPVASRIYAYTSLAQYEAIRFMDSAGSASIAEKLNGFGAMPVPEAGKEYNYILAATKAFCTVAYDIRIFSKDSLQYYEKEVLERFRSVLKEEVYQRSIAFGDTVGKTILKRAAKDNYKQTRGMAKYLGSNADGKWRPTQPDYADGAEPNWNKMYCFSMDSAAQFRPVPPPPFSSDTNSRFYKMVAEVYNISNSLSEEKKTIARFWDDNPFVVEHSGHLSFANKKITPGGHWMGIASIAGKKSGADAVKTARAFALTAIALLDGFISCWDAKYRYEYVRPITVINQWMGKGNWSSFLQTPPFPEYTSGHSTISGSASAVLTQMFGNDFAFYDNSDSAYIGLTRNFNSFSQAAEEASISRLYGGIHYRISLDTGLARGRMIGANLLKRLGMQQ